MRIGNNEFALFYANYIRLASDFDLNISLEQQKEVVVAFFKAIPENKLNYSYMPSKWTIKDVLLHLIDVERIFAYRALRIGRNDKTPLPGFEENDYVLEANALNRTIESLIEEYISVRNATIALFNSFSEEQLIRMGVASENQVSVRAIGFIIMGHEKHHVNIIRERYL